LAEPQRIRQQSLLARRIHNDRGGDLDGLRTTRHDPHAGGARSVEQHRLDPRLVVTIGALGGRILEQQLVELRPLDLPRLRTLTRIAIPEEKRLRLFAGMRHELDAELRHKVAVLHTFQDPQSLERPIRFRHQRFADMKAGIESRSTSSVDQPASATKAAAVEPPGPPPMTTQSYRVFMEWNSVLHLSAARFCAAIRTVQTAFRDLAPFLANVTRCRIVGWRQATVTTSSNSITGTVSQYISAVRP